MHSDPHGSRRARAAHHYLDNPRRYAGQSIKRRRRPAGCSPARGQARGHNVLAPAAQRPRHAINAPADALPTTRTQSVLDGATAEPDLESLTTREDPELSSGNRGDAKIHPFPHAKGKHQAQTSGTSGSKTRVVPDIAV